MSDRRRKLIPGVPRSGEMPLGPARRADSGRHRRVPARAGLYPSQSSSLSHKVEAEQAADIGASRSVSQRAILTTADQCVSSVSNFAVGVVVARVSGIAGLGAFSLAYASWLLVAAIHRALVTDPMAIMGDARHPTEGHANVRKGFAAEVTLGIVSGAIIAALGVVLLLAGQESFGISQLAIAPWITFLLLQDYWRWVGFMQARPGKALANDIVFDIVQLVGFVFLFVAHIHSTALAIGAWGLGALGGALFGLWQFRTWPSLSHGLEWLRAKWAVSRWLAGTSTSGWGLSQLQGVLTAAMLGPAALGGLKAAQGLVSGPAFVLIQSGGSLGLPEASRAYDKRGVSGLNRVARLITASGVASVGLVFAVVVLFGRLLLTKLYGAQFAHYAPVAVVVAAGYILGSWSLGATLRLKTIKQTRLLFLVSLWGLLVSIVAVVILGPWLGVMGVAYAFAVGTGLYTVGLIMAARWATRKEPAMAPVQVDPLPVPGQAGVVDLAKEDRLDDKLVIDKWAVAAKTLPIGVPAARARVSTPVVPRRATRKPRTLEQVRLRRVQIVWALLFLNVLTFTVQPIVLPIPHIVGQLLTQGALGVAFVLALTINPKVKLRPNFFLGIYSLLAVTTLMMSVRFVSLGTVYRASRLVGFIAVLWLITPWWGRRDLLLVRVQVRFLIGILASVLLGLAISPHKAYVLNAGARRLYGAIWPMQSTAIGHYTAELTGLAILLWLCKVWDPKRALIVAVPAVVALLLCHTRTAMLAMLVALVVAALSLFAGSRRVRRTFAAVLILGVGVALPLSPLVSSWVQRGETTAQVHDLSGRTLAWQVVFSEPRPEVNKILGSGMTNGGVVGAADPSDDGLPIDSSWVATYQNQGLLGDILEGVSFLVLLTVALLRPRGPARAMAIFLIVYCLISAFAETGMGDASSFLLDLALAASLLLAPLARPRRRVQTAKESGPPGQLDRVPALTAV
jgi:O-antigen/teichoic acid export membrane protein